MTLSIVAFAGSLRTDSLNRRLIANVPVLTPATLDVTVFDDLAGVPLFDEDLEVAQPDGPGAVSALRAAVAQADGLFIATPEYNQSVPGVMKNAVDWLSRPDHASVLDGKPVAITGATTGPWGTRYAQKELRHALTAAGAIVMPQPMLFVPNAEAAFGPGGELLDPAIRGRLIGLLSAFVRWTQLLSATAEPVAVEA